MCSDAASLRIFLSSLRLQHPDVGALVFTPLSWPFLLPSKQQLSLVSWLINSWSPAVQVFKTPHFHPQHFLKSLIAIVQGRRWNPGLGVC